MEVTPGYKQTEVGVIPEDWEVRRIYELVKHGPKNGYSGRSGKDSQGTPTLSLSATSTGRLVLDSQTVKYLEERISPDSDLFLKPGDILVQRSNTIDLVGTTAIFTGPPATFIYPDLMMRLRFKELVSANWFWRYANSVGGRRFFMTIAAGSTGSMPKISGEKLREMPVPVPSLPEQEAIAEVLSKADALVESYERLIPKKRLLKRGVMQKLLRPKDGWATTKLGRLGVFLKGSGVRKDESMSGDLPCVRYGEIYTKHSDYIKRFHSWISKDVAATARRLKTDDLLFAGSGETKEEIGKCVAFVDDFEAYAGGDIVILRPENANSVFMGYYLNTAPINQQKASKGQGNAVVHISASALADVDITIPSLEEQTAIAALLSAMDAEIALLETQLAKYRRLKQGLMQKLLTGRIRLV